MNEMLDRLVASKDKMDAGQQLTEEEQAQLEADLQELATLFTAFFEALREAFVPIITHLAETLKKLWEALPQEYKDAIQQDMTPPLKVNLGDVATRYSPQNVSIVDSEARRADHYPGRGGW